MGSVITAVNDYKTDTGYYISKNINNYGEKYTLLITPFEGFEGLFFFIRKGANYEIEGNGSLYYHRDKDLKKNLNKEIKEFKQKLEECGRFGFFFIDKNRQIYRKEWVKITKN